MQLPVRWAICDRCRGNGKVDNPAFSNGWTGSEWAEQDEDFREGYIRGDYDVLCDTCCGSGKVEVFDHDAMNDRQRRRASRIERVADARAAIRANWGAEEAAERRMGA